MLEESIHFKEDVHHVEKKKLGRGFHFCQVLFALCNVWTKSQLYFLPAVTLQRNQWLPNASRRCSNQACKSSEKCFCSLSLSHAGHPGWEPTLALVQWTWTYWVSSGTRTGWGRLWRPPHRRAAGVTGSGRSARKTGRRAPSVRSGCRLSDCFLETHTYI